MWKNKNRLNLIDNSTITMKKITFIFSVFLALAAVQSCSPVKGKEDPIAEGTRITETFLLKKDKVPTHLQLPGELIAYQQVDLYAKVTSFVKELKVDIGSEVTAGQLLISLDAPELTSQLSAAESRLHSLEAVYTASKLNYDRLAETSKTPGTISQNDLDAATAKEKSDLSNLNAAKADYKEVSEMKSYLEITAPFSGIITSRNVNTGAYVGPAGKGSEFPLLTLQEQKRLRLAISVPEAFTGYLNQGDEISFSVKSMPNNIYKAKVARLAGALDMRLRSEKIEMDVINTDKKLLPGMVAEVSISLAAKDSSFIIPKTGLVNSDEGIYVIKVTNGKAEHIPVKKGREMGDSIEIFGSLTTNDVLIKKASEEIKNGKEIKTQ
jgi:membrane fusion protein (multidrug efflux system)